MQKDTKKIYELEERQIAKLSLGDLTDYANALYLYAKEAREFFNNKKSIEIYFDLNRIEKTFKLIVDCDCLDIPEKIFCKQIEYFQHLLNLFFKLERRNSRYFKENDVQNVILQTYQIIRLISSSKDDNVFEMFSRLKQFCWNTACK